MTQGMKICRSSVCTHSAAMQRLGAADRTIWYVDSRRRGLNRPPLRLINDLFYLLHRSHEKVSDAFKVCQAFAQNISFSTVYTVVDVDGCVIITKKTNSLSQLAHTPHRKSICNHSSVTSVHEAL